VCGYVCVCVLCACKKYHTIDLHSSLAMGCFYLDNMVNLQIHLSLSLCVLCVVSFILYFRPLQLDAPTSCSGLLRCFHLD